MTNALSNQIPTSLTKEDGTTITPQVPYIMSVDTKTLYVSDYFKFDDNVPLAVFKSVIINSVETFANAYSEHLFMLVRESERVHKREVTGKVVIDPNTAMNLIGRVQMRLEEFYKRLNDWDGYDDISVLLPYAEVGLRKSEIIGKPDEVDTTVSNPYVNGAMFTCKWKKYNFEE